MSVKHTGEIYDLDLPKSDASVLTALADNADSEGNNAWANVLMLSYLTNYSEGQVKRSLARMGDKGIITTMEKEVGRNGEVCYSLHFEMAPKKLPFVKWALQRRTCTSK